MATPTTTIDALPTVTTVTGSQLVIVQETGVTKKVTIDGLVAYLNEHVVSDVVWVGPSAPADPTVEMWWDTDATAEGTDSSMVGLTVDTDEAYRVIMFSNGTVRAIPVAAVDPDAPTGLARTVRINSVRLTWTAVSPPDGPPTYIVRRNGAVVATVTTNNYRDTAVTVGETYTYTVQTVSVYSLRSAQTSPVTAFVDPALNIAPSIEVRTWPATIPLGNRAIVRVNVIDADVQTLAVTLDTDVGSLIPTADPTVWYLEPA